MEERANSRMRTWRKEERAHARDFENGDEGGTSERASGEAKEECMAHAVTFDAYTLHAYDMHALCASFLV